MSIAYRGYTIKKVVKDAGGNDVCGQFEVISPTGEYIGSFQTLKGAEDKVDSILESLNQESTSEPEPEPEPESSYPFW